MSVVDFIFVVFCDFGACGGLSGGGGSTSVSLL